MFRTGSSGARSLTKFSKRPLPAYGMTIYMHAGHERLLRSRLSRDGRFERR